MKNKIWLFAFVILFLSLASAQVPSFHQFYGSVLYPNGSLVTESVIITSSISGSFTGSTTSSNGQYGYTNLFFVEALSGTQANISFAINGHFSRNYTFQEEQITQLNLTYNVSAPLICIDEDGDNYNIEGGDCGAVDCDDINNAIHPGASEACGDGIDNDCSGGDQACYIGNGNGNGNGGSGGPILTFNIDTTQISLVLLQGETKQIKFRVTDAGIGPAILQVTSDLDMISEGNFTLPAGGSVTITLDVTIPLNTAPDAYVGHIYITSKGIKKEVLIGIEVTTIESLFDIVLEIPTKYEYVLPGKTFEVTFTLTKLTQETIDGVLIKYIIKNENDEDIFYEEETKSVTQTQETFTKEFAIPENINYGKYLLYAQINYDNKTASASQWFNIGPRKIDTLRWTIILAILSVAIIIVVILIIVHYKRIKYQSFQ